MTNFLPVKVCQAPVAIDHVVLDREFPQAPEKIWRALTEKNLIDQWLMQKDFQPVVGHKFKLSEEWGAVDGQVLTVEPNKTLSYKWDAMGLESIVTWTLTPTSTGTHVQMVLGLLAGSAAGIPRRQLRLERLP